MGLLIDTSNGTVHGEITPWHTKCNSGKLQHFAMIVPMLHPLQKSVVEPRQSCLRSHALIECQLSVESISLVTFLAFMKFI